MGTSILGIDQYTPETLADAVRQGGKFVQYDWAISVLVMSFRNPTNIYFIAPGRSSVTLGLVYSLMSATLGWWGFPFGIVFTIQALATNFGGGRNLTNECWEALGLGHVQYANADAPPREAPVPRMPDTRARPMPAHKPVTKAAPSRKTYHVDRME
ncbi:MAG: hypothetical protein IPP14_15275 [Planctomycetes bacterium]|nr:hypothetical protein [Planctomycetota bacterium]